MTYDEIIKKAGKRIKKHVYYIQNSVRTNVSDESVERIKFDLQTPLIGTSMQTAEIELKEKIEAEIYVEVEAKYKNSTATKTYGPYHLKEEPNYEASKKTYIHKVGDNLIKSMVDYEPLNITFPCTIFEFFEELVDELGYTTNISSLPNGNRQMTIDIFENIGFTYRDVLDDIAVANGVLFYVEGNELKIATLGGNTITIDDDVLKNQNIKFGEHFGPINTIVLSRSGESDNIYYPATLPENPIEFKIVDNQLMNENNRVEFLPALYNQLNGIEYDIYDTELTGWGDVRPLQSVEFETGDNTYTSYIFNNEITLTDGYKQSIYNELPSETETDYKAASKTDKTINQAYIIVRKNEAEIESLARRVVDVSDTKQGVGSIQLENAYEGQLYQLSIKGQISLLFPQSEDDLYGYPLVPSNELVPSNTLTPSSPVPYQNKVLYPSDDLFTKSSNLIVDGTKYKLDFDFLNYINNDICDEFVYDNGTCYIIRRVGIDDEGNKYPLQNEVIEPRRGVVINVESDSIISLESFDNAILKATYLLENEYTDNFATQVEVNSQITQTANSINLEVNKKLDSDEFTGANIILEVNKDGSEAQINADKIDLNANDILNLIAGNVINLTAKNIEINSTNFEVDSNGNLTANNATLTGANINNGDIVINSQYAGSSKLKIIDQSDNTNISKYYPSGFEIEGINGVGVKVGASLMRNFISSGAGNLPLLSLKQYYPNSNDYKYTVSINPQYAYFALYDQSGSITAWTQITPEDGLRHSSREEYKKNIKKHRNNLDLIKNCDVYEYLFKNENDNNKPHIGLIIGKDYNTPSEIINKEKTGINLFDMCGVMWGAIKELAEENQKLKKEMEELKNGFSRISK